MTGQEKCDLLLQVTAWAGLTVHNQASTLTYYSTCPFGQLTKKSTCPPARSCQLLVYDQEYFLFRKTQQTSCVVYINMLVSQF
jgi:hypothetical protein